jgi:uncharacterized protein with GYD domain
MPRFHFDIQENDHLIRDDEGRDFADATAARKEAVETGASIARDAFMAGSADHVVIDVRKDDASLLKISITLEVEDTAHSAP